MSWLIFDQKRGEAKDAKGIQKAKITGGNAQEIRGEMLTGDGDGSGSSSGGGNYGSSGGTALSTTMR